MAHETKEEVHYMKKTEQRIKIRIINTMQITELEGIKHQVYNQGGVIK